MAEANRKVGILGGMGPAAGADFLRLFVEACDAELRSRGVSVCDQAFPEHWLVQVPVPDRTAALLQGGPSPLSGMLRAANGLVREGATSIAIACNTAHAWHQDLQSACPGIELLHIVKETVTALAAGGAESVCLLATQGTYSLGVYEATFEASEIRCHLPNDLERDQLTRGIRDGVKAGNIELATRLFTEVAERLIERHDCKTLVLACTEIPLALPRLDLHP